MPILNFKPQFVEPIRNGRKHHTIRATRKIPVCKGDKLYLYTGLRHTGAYRILAEPVICTRVENIQIVDGGTWLPRVLIADQVLLLDECERLAAADGFNDFAEMMKFWEGRLPFVGQIIHWNRDN
jgi:hypothetical protein